MTSQLFIFRAFVLLFFRPPNPISEIKKSRKSANKKFGPKNEIYNVRVQTCVRPSKILAASRVRE